MNRTPYNYIFYIFFTYISYTSCFIITGSAYNSYDRKPIAGATITMMDKFSSVTTAQTGSTGLFSISVPEGIYNFNITAPGKWYSNINPLPVTSDLSNYDFALFDMQTGMDFEFVTLWGPKPADLDVVLLTPSCNASYKNRECTYGSSVASWAYDCRSGWGPESIVMKSASVGTYEYWVNLVQSSSSDTFSMNENRLPTAYISIPVTDPSASKPAFVTVPTSKDSSLVWWRAIQLVVSAKRDGSGNGFSWTFPNQLFSSPPTSVSPIVPPSPPPSPSPSPNPSSSTSASSESSFTGLSGVSQSSTSSSGSSESTVSSGQPSGSSSGTGTGGGYQLPPMAGETPPENQAGCPGAELKYCQLQMGGCMKTANNDSASNCLCFMELGSCLQRYDCINGAKESFQSQCMNAGCVQSSCQSFATSDAVKILHSWVAIFLIVVSAIGMTQ